MVKKSVIAVIFGGCSSEYEVSLQSAYSVLKYLDQKRYTALAVGITKKGTWLYYDGPIEKIADGTWSESEAHCIPAAISLDRTKHELLVFSAPITRLALDAAFPVLHGKNGEDGTVQGLLELANIPLIGCGLLSSAICIDKNKSHQLAALAGVQVPKSEVFDKTNSFEEIAKLAKAIGYPVFIKPLCAGSSLGISKVGQSDALEEAVRKAFCYDDTIILEEDIPGFEVGCAVMGNQELTVGLVDEIELSQGFFDYEEKYLRRTSKIHYPARISVTKAKEIQKTAKTIYHALGCSVFARVDMFLTPKGDIVFNEVNTIPGFTPQSRYPNMMKGIGITFPELINKLIAFGMEK